MVGFVIGLPPFFILNSSPSLSFSPTYKLVVCRKGRNGCLVGRQSVICACLNRKISSEYCHVHDSNEMSHIDSCLFFDVIKITALNILRGGRLFLKIYPMFKLRKEFLQPYKCFWWKGHFVGGISCPFPKALFIALILAASVLGSLRYGISDLC